MRHWKVLLALLLTAGTAIAAGLPGEAKQAHVAVLHLKGYENGGALTLEINPGPAATRAIRIYSEPSHTLLAIVEDTAFAATEEGKRWRAAVAADQKPRAGAVTPLPQGRPRFVLDPRPATDDRIAAWIYGSWPDGSSEDRLVGDGKVRGGNFEISVAAPLATNAPRSE